MCPYLYYLMLTQSFYRSPQPPFGPPPMGPPTMGPGMSSPNNIGAPPMGPPPNKIPIKPLSSTKFIDSGSIRICKYRLTYIWLNNGQSFWMRIMFIGQSSISGWRWNGRRWVRFGIDTRRIESFVC